MNAMYLSRVISKVSLVLNLRDSYTGEVPGDPTLRVELLGQYAKPIRKGRGLYIYENLPVDKVTIDIRSSWYENVRREIDLSELGEDMMCHVRLDPTASYPYPPSATLIRAKVDASVCGEERTKVSAFALDPDCAITRLSDKATKGVAKVGVASLSDTLKPGDMMVAYSNDLKLHPVDIHEIISMEDNGRTLHLREPIKHTFPKGTSLMTVSQTYCDVNGEMVVPIRNCHQRTFTVALLFTCGETTMVREVEVCEGTTITLGLIHLKPS